MTEWRIVKRGSAYIVQSSPFYGWPVWRDIYDAGYSGSPAHDYTLEGCRAYIDSFKTTRQKDVVWEYR